MFKSFSTAVWEADEHIVTHGSAEFIGTFRRDEAQRIASFLNAQGDRIATCNCGAPATALAWHKDSILRQVDEGLCGIPVCDTHSERVLKLKDYKLTVYPA